MQGVKAKIRKYKATRWILIFTNWVSQGIWHMDRTEQIYRISFTFLFTFITYFFVNYFFSIDNNLVLLIISFIISHTLNWVVNSNLFTLFVHRLLIGYTKKGDFFSYMEGLKRRVEKVDSIIAIYGFGSLSRGELKEKSDLDISFLRNKGFKNAIKSIVFITKEKKISQSLRIPIESFLCDNILCFKKRYSLSEPPVVINDKLNKTSLYFDKYLTLADARKLNDLN